MLLAEGNSQNNGSLLFYLQFNGKAEETAVTVSRIFLGTQLQCAHCHDHPFDKWKQLDFYGLAGFFARQVVVSGAEKGKPRFLVAEKSTGEVLFTRQGRRRKARQEGRTRGGPFPGRRLPWRNRRYPRASRSRI